MNFPATEAALQFANVEQLIETLRPSEPVYALYPDKFRLAAHRFLHRFAGDTLYAVKANPAPQVLDQVYAAGIRHFDTASLPEIELVRSRFPGAQCHFMAPVRIGGAAHAAFHQYGVTDYAIVCDLVLEMLLAVIGG